MGSYGETSSTRSGGRKVYLGPAPYISVDMDKTAIDTSSLAMALRRSVGRKGMRMEDAEAIASNILNFFGFNERIIDNILEPDDRDVFYMLEDCGLLETERDETTLYDGREWRIHYWSFRKDRILNLASEEAREMEKERESGLDHVDEKTFTMAQSIYGELGDEVWTQHQNEAS
jgi:hypothetical protein